MELLCRENNYNNNNYDHEPSAIFDPAIVDDDRTLANLIFTEEHYLIAGSYFKCLQTDLTPNNRSELATWMLEVCEAEQCQSEVFPLAMNILDRFLALVKLRKNLLQLLGSVCLFIASKLRQSRSISPQQLIFYTDWSVNIDELSEWELLVLSKLKWDVAAVTPNDFVGPLLRRLCKHKLIAEHQARIKKHILNMIDLCALDFNFSMYPPSMIAAASIITAVDGLLALTGDSPQIYRSISSQVLYQLNKMTGIEKELLRECHLQIEQKILLAMQGGNVGAPQQQQQQVDHHHHGHGGPPSHEKSTKMINLVANDNNNNSEEDDDDGDDFTKENYNSSINIPIVVNGDNNHLHHHPHHHHHHQHHHHHHHQPSHCFQNRLNTFKHGNTACGGATNDTSIGVEY